jgi:protein required for attachment to host cells
MKLPAEAHVAVIDGERFLLMRNGGTAAEPTLEAIAKPSVPDTNKSAGQHDHEGATAASRSIARPMPPASPSG